MAKQDTHPGLGGNEATAARAVEPEDAGDKLRVLMLRDMTTKQEQIGAVESQAQAAGFDVPVLLNVDEVHVEGVLETLAAAREAGKPFHILVESIWRRPGLPEFAKAQQPGLHSIAIIYYATERNWFAHRNPAVDSVVSRNEDMAAQMGVAFQAAKNTLLHPSPAPAHPATV